MKTWHGHGTREMHRKATARFRYIKHLLEFRWGYCRSCKHFRTNMMGHWCGYCDFMDDPS